MTIKLLLLVGLVVLGQVVYHVVMRGPATKSDALSLLVVAYGTSLGLCLFLRLCILGPMGDFRGRTIGLGMVIGAAVAAVELGYVLAYRHGLPGGTGALMVLGISTVVLVPVSSYLFADRMNLEVVGGATLALAGLALVAHGSGTV